MNFPDGLLGNLVSGQNSYGKWAGVQDSFSGGLKKRVLVVVCPCAAVLRSSSNLYYSDVRSPIFLPRDGTHAPEHLVKLLSRRSSKTVVGRDLEPALDAVAFN